MNPRLVVATGSKHKLDEIKAYLKDWEGEICGKDEIGTIPEPEENADTLLGNARIKAQALKEMCDDLVLADDTGLFVEALQGEPGVHSARYAGEGHDDEANKRKLLMRLEGEENRYAEFRSVLVLLLQDGTEKVFEGICPGRISKCEMGNNGFGYDPLFIPDNETRSFAQMSEEEKNAISHRGKALQKLSAFLSQEQKKRT